MERLLITQSLISSWDYIYSCRNEFVDTTKEEFLKTLRREPKESNENMRKGIEFEDEVYKVVSGEARTSHKKWERGIQLVAARFMNAPTQIKAQRDMTISGKPMLLYGVLDALQCGTIYDVKFSTKSFNDSTVYLAGKYLHSAQHPMYLALVPEAQRFTYLLSDGQDLYEETYTRSMARPIEDIIAEFLRSIQYMGLMKTYEENWGAK